MMSVNLNFMTIDPGCFLVAMAVKFETKSAVTWLV